MRVIIDTNVLVSALLSTRSAPAHLITLWRHGQFTLLTSAEQLEEVRRVTRYPKIRERLSPALAGRLVNDLGHVAEMLAELPRVTISPDPHDNYLLGMIEAGRANMLVTGDKVDLLALERHAGARIVTARQFLDMTGHAPHAES